MSYSEEIKLEKQKLLEDYNANKEFLDTYKLVYLTYITKLKQNEQIEDELYCRFDIRL